MKRLQLCGDGVKQEVAVTGCNYVVMGLNKKRL